MGDVVVRPRHSFLLLLLPLLLLLLLPLLSLLPSMADGRCWAMGIVI